MPVVVPPEQLRLHADPPRGPHFDQPVGAPGPVQDAFNSVRYGDAVMIRDRGELVVVVSEREGVVQQHRTARDGYDPCSAPDVELVEPGENPVAHATQASDPLLR